MDIELKLSINRGVICSNSIIGKTYENKATRLIFELPDEMINKWFYIEFELPDGTKISTEKLEILDNKVIYEIPNNLLESQGKLKLEVVLRNADNLVWRSYTQTFNIINSINATEYIEEEYKDFITESQKVIDLVELNGDGYSYLSNDGTYKRVEAVAANELDPTVPSYIKEISEEDINLWNNKQERMEEISNEELDEIFSDL